MNKKSLLNRIVIGIGLFLGAFALSALAVDWTAPTANPPANNAPAPVNVSISPQAKAGPFAVGKATAPSTGYNLDVAGSGLFTGLLVSGDLRVMGTTTTDRLTVGGVDIGKAGYVLTNKGGTGEAEWKPNTSGLSGASRIYCAAGSSGDGNSYSDTNNYFKIKSPQRLYEIVKKIEGKGSPRDFDLGGKIININYLDGASPSNPTQGIVAVTFKGASVSTPPSVSCPAGKELIFHSMIGSAKDEEDDNNMQIVAGVVTGDYVANSISCVSQPNDRPTFIAGVGLCI
jgi:hypothetical protein